MKIIETSIPDAKLIEPEVFGDERGFFYGNLERARLPGGRNTRSLRSGQP